MGLAPEGPLVEGDREIVPTLQFQKTVPLKEGVDVHLPAEGREAVIGEDDQIGSLGKALHRPIENPVEPEVEILHGVAVPLSFFRFVKGVTLVPEGPEHVTSLIDGGEVEEEHPSPRKGREPLQLSGEDPLALVENGFAVGEKVLDIEGPIAESFRIRGKAEGMEPPIAMDQLLAVVRRLADRLGRIGGV